MNICSLEDAHSPNVLNKIVLKIVAESNITGS